MADDLAAAGQAGLAARIRGSVPETFGLCDEHVPLLREALHAVVATGSPHSDGASKALAALNDLPAHIGRRGQVWVGRSRRGAYSAHWTDDEWLEQGPLDVPLAEALTWAEARSDDVRRNDG